MAPYTRELSEIVKSTSYADVILADRLRNALAAINAHLPVDALDEVVKKVQQTETPSLVEENRRLHKMIVEGVDVELTREDGSIGIPQALQSYMGGAAELRP
mgnify:CR=1 FL=1